MSSDLAAIPANEKPHIGLHELPKTTGQGTFVNARLAWHIPMGTEVAVKVINWQGSPILFQEVHYMMGLNHH